MHETYTGHVRRATPRRGWIRPMKSSGRGVRRSCGEPSKTTFDDAEIQDLRTLRSAYGADGGIIACGSFVNISVCIVKRGCKPCQLFLIGEAKHARCWACGDQGRRMMGRGGCQRPSSSIVPVVNLESQPKSSSIANMVCPPFSVSGVSFLSLPGHPFRTFHDRTIR